MSMKKRVLQTGFFLLVMFLTFYALFSGKDITQIWKAVDRMSVPYLIPAAALALFFVSAEGCMIWYLLKKMEVKRPGSGSSSLIRCIQYSFIGFFYSGITPSATGGQPVQLYYMNKDGNRGSDSTVVLMTVALAYKFVLVILGAGILCFWFRPLREEFGKFFPLYILGLCLNAVLVVLILTVMLFPKIILNAAVRMENLFVRIRKMQPSGTRVKKIQDFIDGYQQAVTWLKGNKKSLFFVMIGTFFQRSSLFVLTYVVYLGFGLHGTNAVKVILLQASVYIAVDMLPLPGSQGITELVYQTVFVNVFTGAYLLPSMMVSRGINFYFLLLISLAVVAGNRIFMKRPAEMAYKTN